jgi:predicted lactoylglutathione lyase
MNRPQGQSEEEWFIRETWREEAQKALSKDQIYLSLLSEKAYHDVESERISYRLKDRKSSFISTFLANKEIEHAQKVLDELNSTGEVDKNAVESH